MRDHKRGSATNAPVKAKNWRMSGHRILSVRQAAHVHKDETGWRGRPDALRYVMKERRPAGDWTHGHPAGLSRNFPRRYYPDRVRRVSLSLVAGRRVLPAGAKHPCFVSGH
ncbi:protein of unknown function [Paraburkholderia kururiensis]